jgi:flap endonuclease-1
MGVDLGSLIQKKRITLDDLSGKTLAVDGHNALYQFLAIIRGESGESLMDRQGRVTSHLSGLFYRTINLLEKRIKLIYVFDGQPPKLKELEVNRRISLKKEAVIKYREALKVGKKEEIRKYAQMTSRLTDEMVEDAKKLLNAMGIPWVQAPSEGEAQAAYMTSKGYVFGTVSQDHDSLLFGSPKFIKNLTISGRRKLPRKNVYINIEPEMVDLDLLCHSLGITREQLVDVSILLGTDFNPNGFTGIGPVNALKLIKTHDSLENITEIESLKKTNYQAIRDIFLKPNVTDSFEIKWNKIHDEEVVNFLCKERDFSENRVKSALNRIKKTEEKRSETLERWFS